ncbi:PTS glucose transporter subunit IIA [Fodinisporobacter ferrooxydans]|uniref:PTS glucose transporter subunit IIA n=1 Tax=Fodinisporobacter ferrooxydans TaxID=2901836 RepID=UPI003242E3B8
MVGHVTLNGHTRGEGFTAHVKVGDTVKVGDPLITFEKDTIAAQKSLISPVLITNTDRVSAMKPGDSRILYTVVLK